MSAHRRRGTGLARLGLVVLVAAAVLLPASRAAARAGDGLTSADPSDGAVLSAAPGIVSLTFSAGPDAALSHVSTRDGSGQEVGTGAATPVGRYGLRLTVAVRAAGDYTIAYHVVFADGTDVIGALRFSFGTGVPPRALNGDALQQARDAVATTHSHDIDPLSAILLTADAAVLAVVVLLLLRRRPTH